MRDDGSSSPKTKVLHIIGSLNRGGTETWLTALFGEMAEDPSIKNEVLVQAPSNTGGYEDELNSLGIQIHLIPRNLAWPFRLFRFLRDDPKFDVVHSHRDAFSAVVLFIAWLARVPVRIAHNHSSAKRMTTGARRIAHHLSGACLRWVSTQRVAVSEESRQSLFGADDEGSRVVFCGIRLESFRYSANDRLMIRARLGIPEDAALLINVAGLREVKNHRLLLNAFGKMSGDGNVHLIIVGDGPLRPSLEALRDKLGLRHNVQFLGQRSDVNELLSAADVFVFPSFTEGLGLAAVEAQVNGLQVVLSNTVPEEVVVLPEYVMTLSPSQPIDDWAAAMDSALKSTLSREIDISLFSRFDIRNNASQISKLYKMQK